MSDSREVYAWPEMALYVFTGNGSALQAYAQEVSLQVTRTVQKFLLNITGASYTQRTRYVETNKEVALSVGKMYAGPGLYGMLASGASISASVNFYAKADGATAQFVLWSGQMTDFSLRGAEGDTFQQDVKIIAPDVSGL